MSGTQLHMDKNSSSSSESSEDQSNASCEKREKIEDFLEEPSEPVAEVETQNQGALEPSTETKPVSLQKDNDEFTDQEPEVNEIAKELGLDTAHAFLGVADQKNLATLANLEPEALIVQFDKEKQVGLKSSILFLKRNVVNTRNGI